MTAAHQHPTDDALAQYGLGTLDDTAGTVIDQHLTTCPDCRRRVAEVSADGFLDRLQSAVGESAPGPTGTAVQGDTDGPLSAVPGGNAAILAQLQTLPQYADVRPLGQGGMGAVFLARNTSFKRDEVLKVVIPSRVGSAEAMARFQQEIEAIGQLNHPNVVTPYATHRVGDLLVLSMEFAGDSLDSYLTKTGPLPIQDACRFVAQAADGLQHAFEKKVVHRDIKPSNLLLTQVSGKPVVKIVDFGLAKAREETQAEASRRGLTNDGVVMGTLAYLSPEQARDSKTADIRTDIYALGCTLYALLTGRPPFAADSPTGFLFAHAQDAPPRLDAMRPDVPPKLAEVALKMLAKAPKDRYQTPAEVAAAVEPFVTGGTTVDWTPPAQPPGRWKKKAGIAAAVLAGLAVVAVAASTLFVKTKDGTVELTDLAPDAEVFVDDGRVEVKWADGKKSAEIRVKPGTRKIEVKQGDVTVLGESVEVASGGTKVLTARQKVEVPPEKPGDDDFPPPTGPAKIDPAFVPLFNGKDLTNWTRSGNQAGVTTTVLGAGALVVRHEGAKGSAPTELLLTKPGSNFRHFHLRIRAFRSAVPGAALYLFARGKPTGPGGHLRISFGSADPTGDAVGLVRYGPHTAPLLKELSFAPKQAYTMDVILQGNRLIVEVDGQRTGDVNVDTLPTEPGDIKLHVSAGSGTRILAIEIKPLPAPAPLPKAAEFKALFNGKDLTGWEQVGNEAATWKVVNGTLVGTFPDGVGGNSVLRLTKPEYRHFHLRLRTMKSEGWQSRVHLFSMNRGETAARYRVSLGSPQNNPGEEIGRLKYGMDSFTPLLFTPKMPEKKWFTMDIVVLEKRVTVEVDGVRTAELTDDKMPDRPCDVGLYLGASLARFQSVEIKELPAPK